MTTEKQLELADVILCQYPEDCGEVQSTKRIIHDLGKIVILLISRHQTPQERGDLLCTFADAFETVAMDMVLEDHDPVDLFKANQ